MNWPKELQLVSGRCTEKSGCNLSSSVHVWSTGTTRLMPNSTLNHC